MKLFPILTSRYRYSQTSAELVKAEVMFAVVGVPWDMMIDHSAQAMLNHSQSISRLADRGGLSAGEALAVVEGRKWSTIKRDDEPGDHAALTQRINEWLAKHGASS